jgi:hypothetical protein
MVSRILAPSISNPALVTTIHSINPIMARISSYALAVMFFPMLMSFALFSNFRGCSLKTSCSMMWWRDTLQPLVTSQEEQINAPYPAHRPDHCCELNSP